LIGRLDRHGAWILNGVVLRIAQKMGLHRDGEFLGLSPFESEMRRRVWWQILLLDTISALTSGLGQSLLPRVWDAKKPLNIDDTDLFPSMSTLQPKDGPTDMVFVLIHYDVGTMMIDFPSLDYLFFKQETGTVDDLLPADVQLARKRVEQLEDSLNEILSKCCDPAMGPIHQLAMGFKPALMSKVREFIEAPLDPLDVGAPPSPRDRLFRMTVASTEHELSMYRAAENPGHFMWYLKAHFHVEIFIYMVGQLSSRSSGKLVERAWSAIEAIFGYHEELFDLTIKEHASLAVHILRAWKVRTEALQNPQGAVIESPGYIVRLQGLLSSYDSRYHTPSDDVNNLANLSLDPNPRPATSNDVPWDQMLGFVDSASINWDVFPNPNENQTHYAGFMPGFEGGTGSW
jgi:hypothetical protein